MKKNIKCKIKVIEVNGCTSKSNGGFICTRGKGHKGKHHAHGGQYKDGTYDCFDRW